jgi:exopolyphosphatase / guanosine-5'-triphosphate,3'-diphosphate pyrophosphatase
MRVAAIDVGSNSIHMVVAQVESDGRFHVLDRAKEMVRLGHRSLHNGRLTAEAIEAGVRTLAAFRTLAERQGVTRFQAVATSAVRETRNGGDFIRKVKEEVGLRIKVIPGREEARLIYLGVRHAIDLRGEPSVIVDAGGGSVECILTEDERALSLDSVKLGVARLSEAFLQNDPPDAHELEQLEAHIAEKIDPVLDRFAQRDVRRVIGTSGTMLNLISIVGYQRGDPPNGNLNHYAVTAEEIARVRRQLCKAERDERRRIPGLDEKRVDFIVAGAVLADHVLRRLGAKQVIACTWALREGVLLDFIARHRKGIEESERFDDSRRRSVVRFARHMGESGEHSPQVARLALRLFDQLAEQLELEPPTRELLEYAALLHDVGHHIGHDNHQKHAYYLISNGDLLGFTREEIEIVAQTARYHRKGGPKDTDEGYRSLSSGDRRTVRALSAILRVADGLDRSHYGVVRDLDVSRRADRLNIVLHTQNDDAQLEIWEARNRSGLLGRVLGCEVDFKVTA